jgi:glycosyltransferase involved in cell wall biosynthesis
MYSPKTKIAIISQSLGGGGAERFAGLLGFMLTDLGFEVHNIILNEPQDYEYSGALLNLGALYKNESEWKRKFLKMTALKKYLSEHQIDTIIDNRTRSQFFRECATRWVYGNRKIYYLIHNYKLDNYLPDNEFLAKWLYGNAQKLICVSKAIEEKVKVKYHFNHTTTIYNPINIASENIPQALGVPEKYILYYGRFDEKAKNFSLMLEAFAVSEIYKKGYSLLLMGEGSDLGFIKEEIAKNEVTDYVTIMPYQKNPFSIVKQARYTILTSRFEGFPMSIVESLAVGTPVIAVDCNSGPREVIVNEHNGLLVENFNVAALAKAMNRLMDEEDLYERCKMNASKSIAHLSMEAVAKQWQQILSAK